MQADLSGKVALVTGGSRGIGRAIAEVLSANGASVVIAGLDAAEAETVAAALPRAMGRRLDVRDEAEAEAGMAAAVERFGRLDILVNNAGVNAAADKRVGIDRFDTAQWRQVLAVDLDGVFFCARAAARRMVAAGGGRIVNIASIAGLAALRRQSSYVAAKAAVAHLTRSMALELGPQGVLVNAVAPGSVVTEMTRPLFYGPDKAAAQPLLEHIPLRRPGQVEEIAQAALFLAAPASSGITGQVLVVDGGWTAGYSR